MSILYANQRKALKDLRKAITDLSISITEEQTRTIEEEGKLEDVFVVPSVQTNIEHDYNVNDLPPFLPYQPVTKPTLASTPGFYSTSGVTFTTIPLLEESSYSLSDTYVMPAKTSNPGVRPPTTASVNYSFVSPSGGTASMAGSAKSHSQQSTK